MEGTMCKTSIWAGRFVSEADSEGIRNRIVSETTLNLAEGAIE